MNKLGKKRALIHYITVAKMFRWSVCDVDGRIDENDPRDGTNSQVTCTTSMSAKSRTGKGEILTTREG